MLTNVDQLYLVLAFVVPGFILEHVFSMFLTGRVSYTAHSWIRYVVFSTVNYGIWSWLIYLLLTLPIFAATPGLAGAVWFLLIFVSPVALGILFGYTAQKDWVATILRRMGINAVHPIPTAWDWKFGQPQLGAYVLVTLSDDDMVAGFFSGGSFASSDPRERDLYVEQVFDIDAEGEWHISAKGKGVLVPGSRIKTIEFFPLSERSA